MTRIEQFIQREIASTENSSSVPRELPEIPTQRNQTVHRRPYAGALPPTPVALLTRFRELIANEVALGLPKLPPPAPFAQETSLASIVEDVEEDIEDAMLAEYFQLYINEIAQDGYCRLTHYAATSKTRMSIAQTLGALVTKMTPADAIETLSALDNSTKILMLKQNLISTFLIGVLPRDWFPGSRVKLPTLPPKH